MIDQDRATQLRFKCTQVKRFDKEKQIQVYQELERLFAAEQDQTKGDKDNKESDAANPEPSPATVPLLVTRRPTLKVCLCSSLVVGLSSIAPSPFFSLLSPVSS